VKSRQKHTIDIQQFHAANWNSKIKSFLLYIFQNDLYDIWLTVDIDSR